MNTQIVTLNGNNTTFSFLPSGDIYEICHKDIMVNQLIGNLLDGSANQIYLRVFKNGTILSTPLLGIQSDSKLAVGERALIWSGTFEGVSYEVKFIVTSHDVWFWEVSLQGNQTVDLLYGQDIGIAAKGAVQSNEAYVSQYIDHYIDTQHGYTICSRQNQPQDGKFPYLQQGCLQKTIGFSTDGYQFFGMSYKETNIPEALQRESLPTEVYQYEMAYAALQTEKRNVQEKQSFVFYGSILENHSTAVEKPFFTTEQIEKIWIEASKLEQVTEPVNKMKCIVNQVIKAERLTPEEIDELFGIQLEKEIVDQKLLSFFTDNQRHVVLKEKEVQMERPHGHILLSGTDLVVDKPVMATTVYMYGIFNSQIVLGNTSMNKMMSNNRNSLNIMKKSGQRIYIKINNQWQLLAMPSAFEMGFNVAKWYYKLADDLITVTNYTSVEGYEIKLCIESKKGKKYDFVISNHILMNDGEDSVPFKWEQSNQVITFNGTPSSTVDQGYPELTYHIHVEQPFTLKDETVFVSLKEGSDFPLVMLELLQEHTVNLTIQGNLHRGNYQHHQKSESIETESYERYLDGLLNGFQMKHENPLIQEEVERMNLLSRWYSHNMLVHYLSPHGLEQYGGAAWGTRDVSQGPVEYFFAVNRPEIVREILKKVYANQFENDGNWPQWFMFDRFEKIKADESHGDVIVWPLKVVGDYLTFTGDTSILAESIPFTNRDTFAKTEESYPLMEHVKKQIHYIEENFLPNTFLSCYGDGDWDDTLQPYDSRLKKNMASSWTIALTYQTIRNLARALESYDNLYAAYLFDLAKNIKADFNRFILSTDTIPGFVYMEDSDHVELMIHPDDKKTNIQYRLLPMTRSMIAELITPEMAEHHYQIIKENLYFPDGVRLMNRPASYKGGVSTNFKRAEQAANFGREIGLQYVHAHIRFTEAMAKLGKAEETWKGLNTINPIGLKDRVENAAIRQSNVYFSSSDGDFKTRYEAEENFGKLKNSGIPVKGGWRIYSSGPGIYINQLISNVLGIRQTAAEVIIDPVLPERLNGLTVTFQLLDKPVEIKYILRSKDRKAIFNGNVLENRLEDNLYRQGGICLNKEAMKKVLQQENILEVYC
ncbi:GH36-type glycosyl hydrolase domain-containing protein [Niallia circulans]|uniref:GH36-type glycosyl hydrolase domain-containing protein n=1 Tax=Niallia circulans TaxID=1397 RepID=UPI0015600FC3|nr:cellobiose phosphorylase [Niallia circulans]NRG30837.1 cellobiose phosphorylase [Niallia circulans]